VNRFTGTKLGSTFLFLFTGLGVLSSFVSLRYVGPRRNQGFGTELIGAGFVDSERRPTNLITRRLPASSRSQFAPNIPNLEDVSGQRTYCVDWIFRMVARQEICEGNQQSLIHKN
jgi:hypothetical protein